MLEENIKTMDDFKENIEQSLKKIYVGDVVEGNVVAKAQGDIIVDIGYQAEGIIKEDELSYDPNFNIEDIKIGDKIKVEILDLDDGEGSVLLSKKRADIVNAWDNLEQIYNSQEIIKIKANQLVKGGIIAYTNGIKAFIPASQLSVSYVEDLKDYVDKEVEVKIIELDKEKNKVILSGKVVEQEKAKKLKQEKLNTLEKGEVVEGRVKKLTNFGAFVDIGGIEGLVRNEDLAWTRVKHPSDIVKVGDDVKVYILNVDKKKEKISLGLKDIAQDPWNTVKDKYQVNKIYEGVVSKVLGFGVFVSLNEGIEGLVHISEISEERIDNPSDVLNEGDKVKVKILKIDDKQRKISLSRKQALQALDREKLSEFNDNEEATTSLKNVFSDIFNKLNK
ncbi:MAG: 30S ribosomal protein S1 [Eubacteriales bacterium]